MGLSNKIKAHTGSQHTLAAFQLYQFLGSVPRDSDVIDLEEEPGGIFLETQVILMHS